MRYRDIENLFPTDIHLNLHRVTDNYPQTMRRWTDNIVLATRYIGPVRSVKPNLERTILALQVLAGEEKAGNELYGDTNGDGQISIKDTILMLQIAAGSQ
jgi:hypothetical protein